jgi:leukotriene-A4 hydrolase
MTTESFRNYITTYYNSKFGIQLDAKHFDQWILTEGLPEEVASPQADRFRKVDTVLAAWRSKVSINRSEVRGWSTHEWVHFLRNLPEQLSSEEMDQLDQLGNFTDSHNAEIIAVWGVIAIRNNYTRMLPQVEDFLVNTGRRKFLVPLYTELAKTSEGMRHAQTIYKKARPNYHFVATNTFDRLLRADPE